VPCDETFREETKTKTPSPDYDEWPVTSTPSNAMPDSRRTSTRPPALTPRGSFRAGSPLPTLRSSAAPATAPGAGLRRQSTMPHYQTFPTAPPKTAGHRPRGSGGSSSSLSSPPGCGGSSDDAHHHSATPLPVAQLALLALLSLAEQTALNSISPYLPSMVASFPSIDPEKVGVYVGLVASAFALAQLATNLVWGYLSDIIGRKPVMLMGTSMLCLCFALFGFCTRYWQLVVVHASMGLLNGNAAVVPTCLGELTDRSNQSKAFTWLPVVYSLGGITGPALGGLLVGRVAGDKYPYLAPNILGASLLALSVVVLWIWFDETLEERQESIDWQKKLRWLQACFKRSKKHPKPSSRGNGYGNGVLRPEGDEAEGRHLLAPGQNGDRDDGKLHSETASWREILNRTTTLLLITYLIFQVSNVSFGSLYPLFASGPPPTGRGLPEDVIGVSLSVAGVFTILFQLFVFGPIKSRLGNVRTYRGSLLGFAISMALMPWVGHLTSSPPFGIGDSKVWVYVEMGAILVIRNICAVGGLSGVMLLVRCAMPRSLGILLLTRARLPTLARPKPPWARSRELHSPSLQRAEALRRWFPAVCSRFP
jgi:hypothetical protein